MASSSEAERLSKCKAANNVKCEETSCNKWLVLPSALHIRLTPDCKIQLGRRLVHNHAEELVLPGNQFFVHVWLKLGQSSSRECRIHILSLPVMDIDVARVENSWLDLHKCIVKCTLFQASLVSVYFRDCAWVVDGDVIRSDSHKITIFAMLLQHTLRAPSFSALFG